MLFSRNAVVFAGVALSLLFLHTPVTHANDDVSQLKAQLAQLSARLEKVESERTGQIEKDELARMMKEILDPNG